MSISSRSQGPLLLHSSDLHIGDEEATRLCGGNPTLMLERVLATARGKRADALLLAGDIFENNRVPAALADRVGDLLAAAGCPVVVLPGNHDPLIAASVWRRRAISGPANVHVIGLRHARRIPLAALELEVWGNPHRDYDDMVPLRRPPRTRAAYQVAMAHGHFDTVPNRRLRPRPAWLIGSAEIAATGADYVALGHWNQSIRVGEGPVAAHYSGSPELTGRANLVRLGAGRRPHVRAVDLEVP